jgi:hypothetical protein
VVVVVAVAVAVWLWAVGDAGFGVLLAASAFWRWAVDEPTPVGLAWLGLWAEQRAAQVWRGRRCPFHAAGLSSRPFPFQRPANHTHQRVGKARAWCADPAFAVNFVMCDPCSFDDLAPRIPDQTEIVLACPDPEISNFEFRFTRFNWTHLKNLRI